MISHFFLNFRKLLVEWRYRQIQPRIPLLNYELRLELETAVEDLRRATFLLKISSKSFQEKRIIMEMRIQRASIAIKNAQRYLNNPPPIKKSEKVKREKVKVVVKKIEMPFCYKSPISQLPSHRSDEAFKPDIYAGLTPCPQ